MRLISNRFEECGSETVDLQDYAVHEGKRWLLKMSPTFDNRTPLRKVAEMLATPSLTKVNRRLIIVFPSFHQIRVLRELPEKVLWRVWERWRLCISDSALLHNRLVLRGVPAYSQGVCQITDEQKINRMSEYAARFRAQMFLVSLRLLFEGLC